jgi:alanine-glyoxylate transaminase / serine-glyoxylate transaminase / serine-pyruvate transaminase
MNKTGYWPSTPNTNLLYGLHESLAMLTAEGMPQVLARHQRWAAGVRAAVTAWGLPVQCADRRGHARGCGRRRAAQSHSPAF